MTQTVLLNQTPIAYCNESSQKPPREVIEVTQINAEQLLKQARNGMATVWRGDFHQAKQVLSALKKRAKIQPKPQTNPSDAFHQHRLAQSQSSSLANRLLVQIDANFALNLPRAPQVQAALRDVFGTENSEPFLLPLNQLLGYIGAHEWHKKGVFVPALQHNIHVPFGVFSPIRGEYVDLVAKAACTFAPQSAMDVGTGSGVLAAVLAKAGVAQVWATDNNPRAIECARQNVARLGYAARIEIVQTDLFADECVDLIVCNPPWLPARPTSAIETALYDERHAMLHALLNGAAAHLNAGGQLWIVMSDLAEHLGLRQTDDLNNWFAQAGWRVKSSLNTQPQHDKAQNSHDTLAFARQRETTTLYCLERE